MAVPEVAAGWAGRQPPVTASVGCWDAACLWRVRMAVIHTRAGLRYVVGRSAVRAGNVAFRLRGECRDGEPTAAVQAVMTRP